MKKSKPIKTRDTESEDVQVDLNQGPGVNGSETVADPVYFEESREYLRCNFTDAEIIDLSKKLARQISEHTAAERELKEISTQLKANVTAKETAVSFTAGLVQNGYEYRTVECQRFFDCPENGKKALIRMDTGETVSTDRMTGDDLQGQLFRKSKQEQERQDETKPPF